MLTKKKLGKLLAALKTYHKMYLQSERKDLDESGTRIMVNSFLTEVLGYIPIEEVITEYEIKGTYADYVVQLKGKQHFLVEVKALSLVLSEKHLRQAINYGANEGISWILLTNGKCFDLYRILVNKQIDSRKVFSIDLSDATQLKKYVEDIQFLHKDSVENKGLEFLWNKTAALDPNNVAGLFYTPEVMNFIRRSLKKKFKRKFSDEEIKSSIDRVCVEQIDLENIKKPRMNGEKNKTERNKGTDIIQQPELVQSAPVSISEQPVKEA